MVQEIQHSVKSTSHSLSKESCVNYNIENYRTFVLYFYQGTRYANNYHFYLNAWL